MVAIPAVVVLAVLYLLKVAAPYDEVAHRLYFLLLPIAEELGVPPSIIKEAQNCPIPPALLDLHQIEGLPGIQAPRRRKRREKKGNDYNQATLW